MQVATSFSFMQNLQQQYVQKNKKIVWFKRTEKLIPMPNWI